jgi:hydroxymethylglutaryl-CoA reductase (NADPH)
MCFEGGDELLEIPLATYESPLWPSCARGAKVSEKSGGIQVTLIDERMSRSILLEAKDAGTAARLCADIKNRRSELEAEVEKTSRFAKLIDIHSQQVARLIYLRFEYSTGDAAGHNMTTKASDQLMSWITEQYSELDYVSISANFCTDKKPSAVNGILGRGKNVIAEMTIPEKIVRRFLKTTAAKVVDLNLKKNLIGTMLAGGLRSANAHFANMLLAFYLATGQDAANIVEGSQGFSYAEDRDGDLYFSVTLPNLIVGAIGNGKELDFVQENLSSLGCTEKREPGANSRRLAACCASVVLCGELSLLAAQTNPGELMEAHLKLERS